MSSATITSTEVRLDLNGTSYQESVTSLDLARVKLIELVHTHATQYPVSVDVEVENEDRAGLTFTEDGTISEYTPQQVKTENTPAEKAKHKELPEVIEDDHAEDDLLPPFPQEKPDTAGNDAQQRKSPTPEERGAIPAKDAALNDDPAMRTAPTARDFYSTKPAFEEEPAKSGLRGWLNMFGMRLPATAEEMVERTDTRDVQRGLSSHKTVMVANLKGGAGKTTIAYLLAAVLGRVRGGTVLAWDNNENRGTLAYRSPYQANTDSTAIDLLNDQKFFQGSGQVAELVNFVRPQGSNKFDLLASQDQGSDRPVIDGEGFKSLHSLLASFYRLMVVDTGNASNASTWQAAAEVADEIVIVCNNAEDSAQTAAETIDALVKSGHKETVSKSIAIIIDSKPSRDREKRKASQERLGRITHHFSQHVREVLVLPWEETLEEGERIEWAKLSRRTHQKMLAVAASLVRGL